VAEASVAPSTSSSPGTTRLLVAALAGGATAVALGVYAEAHDPAGEQPYKLFFTGTIQLKAWFCTIAVLLALFQLGSSLRMYGKVGNPDTVPEWLGDAHRLSGTLAFLFTLPVAYHCLWSLGFGGADNLNPYALVHSILGCFFYGAFVTKMVVVRSHGLPGWALPLLGGLVLVALVGVWLTSSLWFFTSSGQAAF
jgi:hypothetical protein